MMFQTIIGEIFKSRGYQAFSSFGFLLVYLDQFFSVLVRKMMNAVKGSGVFFIRVKRQIINSRLLIRDSFFVKAVIYGRFQNGFLYGATVDDYFSISCFRIR